ncbi:hypothetical protein CHU92_10700 [Flavobacterium cyanobacteriorum]|uniref:Uncharacterized protein n=1 Tax=Flavobacterium cyanobacteriorum TaxID=2022802 RepID=A0A255Z420_9FLAO|nr:hypothetical protein [Flavobacterium cyanobacteriorum]OYQ35674.1 hypothetical protein CHU92_10700 [Flavobacterium cyanobacteriorum]
MDIDNLNEEEFSQEGQELFKGLNPIKFEDIQKGFIGKEHPLDKIKIRYSKEDDFKTQWEWLIYNFAR